MTPFGSPSKSMTENFNTYPKGNREENDTFEHKTSDNKAIETSKPLKEEF